MSERVAGALRTRITDPWGGDREAVVLRIAEEDGPDGWGEASPLPGYSPDALDEVEGALDEWAARWIRGEASDAADVPATLPAARCAVDTAVLDLEARRLGVPLYERLLARAAPVRPVERVPVAAVVALAGVERPGVPHAGGDVATRAAVAARVAEGFRTVKLKLGGEGDSEAGFTSELAQLAAIRAAFPYLKLRVDPNGAWSPESARDRIAELRRTIGPELVEQPVGEAELLEFGRAAVPLAADESLRLPGAMDELSAPGGCAALVLKPMVLGGLTACLELAALGFEQGMRPIVSHTAGGAISHAACCELALALAAADPAGGPLAAGLAGHDDLPQRAGPWIVPRRGSGHGVEDPW